MSSTESVAPITCTWFRGVPAHPFDFLMPVMADQQDLVVAADETIHFVVHLRNQRAGGIDDLQAPFFRRRLHPR